MREPSKIPVEYFVDEAGDPVFYDNKGNLIVGENGCSKILIIGYIRTENPDEIRKKLSEVRQQVKNDKYLRAIPSVEKSLNFFHAKDDCPEVKHMVYSKIQEMKFKSEFIVARKQVDRFKKQHLGKETIFYNDLVSQLFSSRMHVSVASKIYFAVRGNKKRQVPLSDAIRSAKNIFEIKNDTKIATFVDVLAQTMTGEPCLQVADYMLWALHRAYTTGEMRYLEFVRPKISFIWDVYDSKTPPRLNRYHKSNRFELNKISPL